jgi:lipopolysaccharide transport system ATP-binding protein
VDAPVIKVEGLGKEYVIGSREKVNETFRDMLASSLAAPFRRFRKLSGQVDAEERFWALKDVSFEVHKGEVVGIIGRNGAGKSTLLKILSRITPPTKGRVEIRGRVGSLLEVGTGFHPELTGRENIFLNGAILGMSRGEIARKFNDIVAFAEIEQFLDTPVKRYSSGMYVRLAFAVAAHLEPEILVVDEVLAVGDTQFQKKCLGKMGDAARGGRTVLFVSHNLAAVQNLCSRCIGLWQGRVFSNDKPNTVVDLYFNQSRRAGNPKLGGVEARPGDGRTRFTDVIFMDSNEQPISSAASGEAIKIKLITTGLVSLVSRISIGFSTLQGANLFVCSTELIPGVCFPIGTKNITCEIPRLPLGAGSYLLTLFIEQNGSVSDWIQEGIELVVEDRDFFGSGRNVPRGWEGKVVLVDHFWRGDSVRLPRENSIPSATSCHAS